MSSLQHDFHSLCVVCQGLIVTTDNRCPKCAGVGDLAMTNYIKHKLSLQRKLQSKRKLKEKVSTPAVAVDAVDVAVSDQPASPIPQSVSSDPPVPDDDATQLSGVRREILSQVKSLFDSFAQSLEARFSSIDYRFSQDIPSATSNVNNVSTDVSQDVINPSLSALSVVAGRSEPMPDRAPSVSYTGDLGTNLGGPAAADVPSGGSSLPRLSFEDLLVTVKFLESSGGSVPDSFLDSLRGIVVYPTNHSFAMGEDSLADSISAFCAHVSDPMNPTPGPSRGGGSIISFLCNLVGVSSLSPPPTTPPLLVVCARLRVLDPWVLVTFLLLLALFSFLGFLFPLLHFFLLRLSLPQFLLCLPLSLLSFLLAVFRLLRSPSHSLPYSLLLLLFLFLSSLAPPLSLPSLLSVFLWLLFVLCLHLLALVLCSLWGPLQSPLHHFPFPLFSALLFLRHLFLLPFPLSLVICCFLPSSSCHFFCLSCRLFWLFGICRLLVFPFGRLFFCSFYGFSVSSCPFSGSSCGFSGSFCFFLFFLYSSCCFFPFFSLCTAFVVCSFCCPRGSSVLP